jgi:hypothetical protein
VTRLLIYRGSSSPSNDLPRLNKKLAFVGWEEGSFNIYQAGKGQRLEIRDI